MKKIKHYFYVPFVGLGNYNGFRGNRWFKNRINIFKQFVVPSLQVQTNQHFTLWVSFTEKQKHDMLVDELDLFLTEKGIKHVFTYSGICFYDDKIPLGEAKIRLMENLHNTMGELFEDIGDVDEVLMTIQPSDDCFYEGAVEEIQRELKGELEAVGYKNGYIMNYLTLDISDYDCNTNPPFYTIKFDKDIFIDPMEHCEYTSLKRAVPGYDIGTPLPSHEWVKDCLNYKQIDKRGFLVGTHTENISTYYDHPFKGDQVDYSIGFDFGLATCLPLKLKVSWRKKMLGKLSFDTQKKIRYITGEVIWQKIYGFLRN